MLKDWRFLELCWTDDELFEYRRIIQKGSVVCTKSQGLLKFCGFLSLHLQSLHFQSLKSLNVWDIGHRLLNKWALKIVLKQRVTCSKTCPRDDLHARITRTFALFKMLCFFGITFKTDFERPIMKAVFPKGNVSSEWLVGSLVWTHGWVNGGIHLA